MAEDWTATQADIAAGIAEVGAPCVLRRPQTDGPSDPWSSGGTGPTYHAFTAVQTDVKVDDKAATFIGQTEAGYMLSAGGVIPTKSDYIAFNIALADIVTPDEATEESPATVFFQIDRLDTEQPGDTPLYYEITIAD